MADGGHIEFRKNANKYIRLLYEDICTQFRTKMQHGQIMDNKMQDDFQ